MSLSDKIYGGKTQIATQNIDDTKKLAFMVMDVVAAAKVIRDKNNGEDVVFNLGFAEVIIHWK